MEVLFFLFSLCKKHPSCKEYDFVGGSDEKSLETALLESIEIEVRVVTVWIRTMYIIDAQETEERGFFEQYLSTGVYLLYVF